MSEEQRNGILLIVDGIPIITLSSKEDVARRVLQAIGERYDKDLSKIYLPVDSRGQGQGLALIRCRHTQDAQEVISRNHGKMVDQSRVISIGAADSSSRLEALRERSLVDSDKADALQFLDLSIEGT